MENNEKPTITTWPQLKDIIGQEHGRDIEKQGRDGDPDWLWDILTEAKEGIKPNSTFYIKWFHRPLESYNLDIDQIYKSYILHIRPN